MRYLRFNTATRVTVGPFLDQADGITPKVSLTVTSEKLTFVVDEAGVPTLILDTAPTASGGANDMVHITGDDSGFYDLELAAADTNHLGRAMLSLNNVAAHCPVFHEFMVIPAVIYDSMILGTDLFDVSVTQILGTAVSTPATAGILDVNVKNIDNDAASASGTVTFPNATLASTTNITAGTVTTATNVTTVNGLASGVITAASIAASALNGKGDWNIGKTGYALSTAGIQAIWDALTSALTTVGSIGKKLADWVIGTTQTGDSFARLGAPAGASISADIAAVKADTAKLGTPAGASVSADIAAVKTDTAGVKTKTDQFVFTVANRVDAQALGIANNAITAASMAADASSEIADQVWEEAIADHSGTVGSTAAALAAAGGGGDPWATALPGAYGAGTAGKIIGDNINATVSSRATQTSVDAVKAKTDPLTFTQPNIVDANIQRINDITINGTGAPDDKFDVP